MGIYMLPSDHRNSYCTGSAGIEATEAALDLMKANIARKEACEVKDERKRKYNFKYNNNVMIN
ncbi:unnamed protein product [Arabis nemorensis]|uniref:Uncharacterized protein n=1 Tax=Arabis nemorensis TaxID=586526 RepID=A0A565CER9_9BRAS|nr:unnamed protein product [Arabis nemorensis]